MQPCVRACCDMFDMCAWWQLKSPGFHVWRAVSSMEPKRATCLRELASMAFIWVRILPRLLSVTLSFSSDSPLFLVRPPPSKTHAVSAELSDSLFLSLPLSPSVCSLGASFCLVRTLFLLLSRSLLLSPLPFQTPGSSRTHNRIRQTNNKRTTL